MCAFLDPPKPTAAAAIARLFSVGVQLKILSGDDPLVVRRLAGLAGLKVEDVLAGADVSALSDEALAVRVQALDPYGRRRWTKNHELSGHCKPKAYSSAFLATIQMMRPL